MNNTLINLGNRIAKMRAKRGLTQEKLAEMVHYSPNHISKLESARTNPSFELLVNIAKAFDVELMELFNFSEYKTTDYMKTELESVIKSKDCKKLQLLYKIYRSLE